MDKNKRTKVFFDAFPLAHARPSGIGHLLAETIKALERNDEFTGRYDIVLIAPRSGSKNLDRWGFKTVKYKLIPISGRIWTALVLFRLLPPADLFFGKENVYVFANYTTWPLLSSKTITYIHDLNFLANPSTVNPKTFTTLHRNLPVWIKRADKIVTISEFSKREIIKSYKVDPGKISVLLCGVDSEVFYPRQADEIGLVKEKYGIQGSYMLFLSNIEPRKNIDRLLDAYVLLPKDLTERYALLIVGADGWQNEGSLTRIHSLQNAGYKIFHPETYVSDDELPALLSGATLLVHPALYEGFGISPLQAMACGSPVVVSMSSSLPEVVGTAGIYVDPMSTDDIKDKIQRALNNPAMRKECSAAGLLQAKKFSWDKSAEGLVKIIGDLVE